MSHSASRIHVRVLDYTQLHALALSVHGLLSVVCGSNFARGNPYYFTMAEEACGKLRSVCIRVHMYICGDKGLLRIYSLTDLEVLVKVFQSVLLDDDFDLPTPPAIAAKKSAEQVLAWHATAANKAVMSTFAQQLVLTLQPCFKEMKKQKDGREKMLEQLYKLRSTNEFSDNWTTFLKKCGVVDPAPTLFQHITDKVFDHLIS